MKTTGNKNRQLDSETGGFVHGDVPCAASPRHSSPSHSPHQQFSSRVLSTKATPGCKGRSKTHQPACLCPQHATSVRGPGTGSAEAVGAAGGLGPVQQGFGEAVPCGQPCHPWDGAPLEVGRGWVLTLWSSWALAFGCCSWPGSTVSGLRYRFRDDGLMRPRSWQREDNWGGEGGPSLTRAWGASGMRGWETPAGRGMGSAARLLAPRPGGASPSGATWPLGARTRL